MLFTRPGLKNLRVFEKDLPKYFENKSVLILGSAPSVNKLTADFMNSFDVIVRVNNYKHHNSCTRTDVFYSMMGGSIMKTCDELTRDGCKLIFCKNPFTNMQVYNEDGTYNHLLSTDCRKGYINNRNPRIHWFELPYYLQTVENWLWVTERVGKVCMSGTAAIVDIYRYKPKYMHIAGMDFFASGIHNGFPLTVKPWPKHHDFKGEMMFIRKFIRDHKNIFVDNTLRDIFANPDKFPKIGNKPE